MRVLLAQNMVYLPAHGGANRSNRIMLEQLAGGGHECRAVAVATGRNPALAWPEGELLTRLPALGATILRHDPTVEIEFEYAGVVVTAVLRPPALARAVIRVARDLQPDWLLVPTDDPGGLVLAAAHAALPDRVVYLMHTLQQLPFGPRSCYPNPAATELVRRCAGAVAVSDAVAGYAARHAGVTAVVIRPHVYGTGSYGGPDPDGATTLVNPCGYKGISIFAELARSAPRAPFLAVPSWGTTRSDLALLASLPNVELHGPVDDIDDVLRRTRVVVMPSLWDETFGYTCVEAMLRGVPVIASDIGGLREAKLGVPYLLPVSRIERYRDDPDFALPVGVVPPQPAGIWSGAYRALLDPRHHAELSDASRTAAERFVAGLDPGALAGYLTGLRPRTALRSGVAR